MQAHGELLPGARREAGNGARSGAPARWLAGRASQTTGDDAAYLAWCLRRPLLALFADRRWNTNPAQGIMLSLVAAVIIVVAVICRPDAGAGARTDECQLCLNSLACVPGTPARPARGARPTLQCT